MNMGLYYLLFAVLPKISQNLISMFLDFKIKSNISYGCNFAIKNCHFSCMFYYVCGKLFEQSFSRLTLKFLNWFSGKLHLLFVIFAIPV